jgi:hypothetical protein
MVRTQKEVVLVDGPLGSTKKRSFNIKPLILGIIFLCTLLIASNLVLAVDGCYIYAGGSEDYVCVESVSDTDAQADCDSNPGCVFGDTFFPGKVCSDIFFEGACEEVTCSDDCDLHPLLVCEDVGGQEVPSASYNNWCSEGCCQVGSFCGPVGIQSECIAHATAQGMSSSSMTYDTSITQQQCEQVICGITLEDVTLQGYVFNENGEPVIAQVELTSSISTQSSGNGQYNFPAFSYGTYTLIVSLDGYATQSLTTTFNSGESAEINFTLAILETTSSVIGTVSDESSLSPLASVTLCYDGPMNGCLQTDTLGLYSMDTIAAGVYRVALSKFGYSSIQENITVIDGENVFNFALGQGVFQGIIGRTYIDSNQNDDLDANDDLVYGAKIYVDDVFRGNSQYPSGEYQIDLDVGEHEVYATYQDYESETIFFVVPDVTGGFQDLLLTQTIGECSSTGPNPQKSVSQLIATAPAGQKAVELTWVKPCPEVSSYTLYKNGESIPISISPIATTFTDYDVEWGEVYEYEIFAVYTDGNNIRASENGAITSIMLGTFECEGVEQGSTFCKMDDSTTDQDERKLVYSCDTANSLIVSSDCRSLDSVNSDWYCTQTHPTQSVCKDAGMCNVLDQLADPFGLYYTKQQCYGSFDASSGYENYCVYDYTNSVANSCESCAQIQNCFGYSSQDACEVNNCFGVGCSWIEGTSQELLFSLSQSDLNNDFLTIDPIYPVTDETGHGYCVQDEYTDDDYCSLCSSDANLFENAQCTADVCSGLGACFSDEELSRCYGCGDVPTLESNCYEYVTELECSGGQNVQDVDGSLEPSNDQCGWNVCAWVSGSNSPVDGTCFKDGNADTQDDCTIFTAGEYRSCITDVEAPSTVVGDSQITIISQAHPEVLFSATDSQNPLKEVWFCLDNVEGQDCTNFESAAYPGLLNEEEVLVNLITSPFLDSVLVSGQTYRLRFFSLDKYLNKGDINEVYVFVDNEVPRFNIEHFAETIGDSTNLDVFLTNQNEPMSCEFTLQSILPFGSPQTIQLEREADKTHTYSSLTSIRVNMSVTCNDDYDNSYTNSEIIVFDTEGNIEIVYPEFEGVVAQNEIAFAVNTLVGAHCELYQFDTNTLSFEKRADFISSDTENKIHETPLVQGFFEGEYPGTVRVSCVESLTNEVFEDYFNFRVDFTAPETQIILTEDTREERPTSYGWEESFIAEAQVEFECTDDGFSCDATYYCFGEECETDTQNGYSEYSSSFVLTNSTFICYYSTDVQGLSATPTCGTISIDGYGIRLVVPPGYYYDGELWGISNNAVFDWELLTRVDTQSCIFDFTPDFAYNSQPLYKHLESHPSRENHYFYDDFPGSVLAPFDVDGDIKTLYLRCENTFDEIGPATRINLEYDPSAPTIESTNVIPSPVYEGIETELFATTDDKTLCKFSDNSDESGSGEFGTMEYVFDGFDKDILFLNHEATFAFGNMLGPTKTYDLNVQCMNGAGDYSQVEMVSFDVDYSAAGYITDMQPTEYSDGADVSLIVSTNKNAFCTFDGLPFTQTSSTQHSEYIGPLDEGEYQYLISCVIGENRRDAELRFIVDKTAPLISRVDDGTQTCGLDTVHLLINTNEANISAYNYELYRGVPIGSVANPFATRLTSSSSSSSTTNSTSSSSSSTSSSSSSSTLISSGSLPGLNGTAITGLQLIEDGLYYVKVLAVDAAGNWGQFKSSDGFIAKSANETACATDSRAPSVHVETNQTCSGVLAELICDDELACAEMKYGTSTSETSCEPTQNYFGNKISFDSSSWICYSVTDVAGNARNGSIKVSFLDSDGDKVANSCDECSATVAGRAVDSVGCSTGQVPETQQGNDQDGDSLPDYWEKLFSTTSCELDYRIKDTTGNGIFDSDEDYDNDDYTNYEEYRAGYDPCLADAPARPDTTETEVLFDETLGGGISSSKESNLGAWVTFILGLLLSVGGSGFLTYFYLYMPIGKHIVDGARRSLGTVSKSRGAEPRYVKPFSTGSNKTISANAPQQSLFSGLKNKLSKIREQRAVRQKSLHRKEIFSEFSTGSKELSHFKDIFQSHKPHKERLGDIMQQYNNHHEEIRSGLQPHEKGLFDKLDSLSKKAKGKSVPASTKEAKDIFEKLKKLSSQRKK